MNVPAFDTCSDRRCWVERTTLEVNLMIRLVLRWAINAVAIWAAITLLQGRGIELTQTGWVPIVGLALIFGLMNALLRPLIEILTCPLIILTLGLGIGASAAIFTIIERVLLQPLDYPQSGQLVTLMHTAPGIKLKELGLSASLYFTYRDENLSFQEIGCGREATSRSPQEPGPNRSRA